MTAIEIFNKWKKDNPQVENVVLFVSDSLRWDYLPGPVAQKGVTFKTVASSTYTASSFPSIITGLYPPHHRVHTFFNTLSPRLQTLLNLEGYNTSLWMENTWIDIERPGQSQLHRLLNCTKAIPLQQLKTPFIYLEDEKGGHCPYGWTKDDIYKETECRKFFRDYGKKTKKEMVERYQRGLTRSVEEFDKRLKILEQRNLSDTTLVIFLSDHGELLGEYGGLVNHGFPTAPEIVYVPIVFIHPGLPKGINYGNEGVLRHVDLVPTILELLHRKSGRDSDGISLFTSEKLPEVGMTYWRTELKSSILTYQLEEKSIWDKNGGYLFRKGSNILLQILYGIYDTTISNSLHALYMRGQIKQKKIKIITNYLTLLRNICSPSIQYRTPDFDILTAKNLIKTLSEKQLFVDEKQKIRKTIDRLKNEGKI